MKNKKENEIIPKSAKIWHFKKPDKLKLRVRLSRNALSAMIGQKVNNGDSCCASVSYDQKSKHRHADNTCHRNLTKRFSKLNEKFHKTEVRRVKKSIYKLKKLKCHHLNMSFFCQAYTFGNGKF